MKTHLQNLFFIALSIFILIGCSDSAHLVNVGIKIAQLEKSPEKMKETPFRLYKHKSVDKNIDYQDYLLAAQAGRAKSKEVMFAINNCLMPTEISGLLVVLCNGNPTGLVYITGKEQIRSRLLHLKKDEVAAVSGALLFTYAETPVILVE